MKLKETLKIEGKNVVLVPYKKSHVLKYHEWMKSAELQELTASEPLTLQEEFEMQKSWHEDENKCTFIILDKETFESGCDEPEAMIGDTNFFFHESEGKDLAEAMIMIAEAKFRGKKLGWESMILMFRFGISELKIERFQVKISVNNEKSIRMFEKLHFQEIDRSKVFQEVTLERKVDEEWKNWLISQSNNFCYHLCN